MLYNDETQFGWEIIDSKDYREHWRNQLSTLGETVLSERKYNLYNAYIVGIAQKINTDSKTNKVENNHF